MKAYYAHPIILFGSKMQEEDIESIKKAGFDVINPDSEEKQAGYKREGMEYFKKLVREADVVFFRAFYDGLLGAGVVTEINWALEDNKPIFEMPRQIGIRSLSVEETRNILKECGRK